MPSVQSRLESFYKAQTHRLLLWYGNNSPEMSAEFDAVDLPGINKRRVDNNHLQTKIEVMLDKPEEQFLLFLPGKAPERDVDNWLLDLQLAFPVFSTDELAVYRDELGLDRATDHILKAHASFLTSKTRRKLLRERLPQQNVATAQELEISMLSAILRSPAEVNEVFLALISTYSTEDEGAISLARRRKLSNRDAVAKALTDHHLEKTLWEYAAKYYSYQPEQPSINDFVGTLFTTALADTLPGQPRLVNRNALLLLSRWKDSERTRSTFRCNARRLAQVYNVDKQLTDLAIEDLGRADLFAEIDQRLLIGLRDALLQSTISMEQVDLLIDERKGTFWYDDYEHHYAALQFAALCFALIQAWHPRSGAQKTLEAYTSEDWKVDRAYRRFHYHLRQTSDQLLRSLIEPIERAYTTVYLRPLGQHWQAQLDAEGVPPAGLRIARQADFWRETVNPYLTGRGRLFVIISDGLRYESAAEFNEWLPGRGRFKTELQPLLAAAPTFTQLGMAALLPHKSLELRGGGSVRADEVSTQGTANRDKILKAATGGRAVAITAEDLLRDYSSNAAGRTWVKDYDVVYIYHNVIDQAGEKEEDQLFSRTQDCFEEIEQLLVVIARMNGNNIILTADHGYLFQHSPLQDNDYASYKVAGDDTKYNRRFVLGNNLAQDAGAMHFAAKQLGLEGGLEVVIPKSIHRLRRSGSGSRYVHGGLSLQELIVPHLHVSIGRFSSDAARPVDVEILIGNGRITNNDYKVRFYQRQPTGPKRSARTLQIGFYDMDGKLLSDEQTAVFDSDAKEERKRETRLSFRFGTAAETGGARPAKLILRDPAGAIVMQREFTLDITFGSDFGY